MTSRALADRISGVLLGTAVGDALGLPREGLSPGRAAARFGAEPRHALVAGRGMVSDDTEHTCMVAQALLASAGDRRRFAWSLAWRLRWWMLALPAGVGFGTARAIAKLWMGFPPHRSGVPSAGNGPAMRSAILGAALPGDETQLRAWVRTCTRITHTDARAERGAFIVALAARLASRRETPPVPAEILARLRAEAADDPELLAALDTVAAHLDHSSTPDAFLRAMGLERGVSGYVNHTVPAALWAWLRHTNDFRGAIADVLALGGDADTTAAITGALAGATCGAASIPRAWLDGLSEWPRSVRWLRQLSERLGADGDPLPLCWPAVLPRNVVFLLIVLGHGFRRLLPRVNW